MEAKRSSADNIGPVEQDPEYQTIISANSFSFEIDAEISLVQKFIQDHYAPRFPELASLVMNPLEYATAVRMIGNEMDIGIINLKSFLPAATVMVINVTATTTNGKPLDEIQLERVNEACDVAVELNKSRQILLDYVETRYFSNNREWRLLHRI